MRTIKSIVAIICIFSVLLCSAVISFAVPAEECTYCTVADYTEYAPPVEKSEIENGCLYYAILSTAGSFAKKYFGASDKDADFSEKSLAKSANNPDIHNFGDVLYKSIGCDIGNDYAITSVEFLTGKGERYLKEKINENGAIVAAFAIPSEGGLTNSTYFNSDENNFAYTNPNAGNDKYHAVSIIGWDDDYDVEKYNKKQNGDYICESYGAWICKNSDGTEFGDNGYFYLSYDTPLLYTAAIEVSHIGGISLTLKANETINYLGFVYGVNIRAYSASTEKVTVNVGSITAFDGDIELKNGCNLILFERPILSGQISVNGENISTSPDTVYCYTSLLPKNRMTVINAEQDENWTEDVENIWISVEKNNPYCLTKNPYSKHIVRKNSNDNCYYIIPADGYRFTKDTVIKKIDGFDDSNLKKLYPDDYKAFKKNSTIEEAVAANYKRLKNSTGEFKTMIEFDENWDNGRGMLKIVGQNIGSAYVTKLNILTDENGAIKNAILTFDDGSELSTSTQNTLYEDESRTEIISDISGLKEYFADVTITGYKAEELTVKINGVPTKYEANADEQEITVSIKISIPDITIAVKELSVWFSRIFAKIVDKIRFTSR